jgi:hypothetical protein
MLRVVNAGPGPELTSTFVLFALLVRSVAVPDLLVATLARPVVRLDGGWIAARGVLRLEYVVRSKEYSRWRLADGPTLPTRHSLI